MKSALQTTLIMIVLAVTSVGAAMYYYPWPEFAEVDAEVGKPLFEEYSADSVRGIDIIRFNSDKSLLERMTLMRRGEKWLIPEKQNFVASESRRIGFVINSLNERTVYDVISENQEDHIQYGVVDPIDYNSQNPDSLGEKLTLTDRNNQKIAEIIVGLPLKNDPNKRYVRIPGKPRVYTIEFDSAAMATEFALWNTPNILRLQSQENGPSRQIRGVEIDNYKVTVADGKPKKIDIYRALMGPRDGKININALLVPREGKLAAAVTTPAINASLTSAIQPLVLFFTDDVRRKSKEAASALVNPSDTIQANALAELPGFGFYVNGSKNGLLDISAANGHVRVATGDGVVTTISIGRPGTPNSKDKAKLNYFVMLNSAIDSAFLKKPTRPANVKEDESEENKAYLRAVANWEKEVERARQTSNDLNAIHGGWYYLVSEDVIQAIRPELALPQSTSTNTEKETPITVESTDKNNNETDPQADPSKDSTTNDDS